MWIAFIGVMLFVALLAPFSALGDVTVYYEPWADAAISGGRWPVIDYAWVYPFLAVVPIAVARFVTGDYPLGWILMVQVLDAAAFFMILRVQKRHGVWVAGWWWIVFIALFGALTLTRLDSVAVPIAIVGLLLALTRPGIAAALLAVATWIKVWPIAMLAALVAAAPRWRPVAVAAGVSAVVVVVALALGSGDRVLSFALAQGERGLEIGSPVATAWLWLASAEVGGSRLFYNSGIEAFEVSGPGSVVAGAVVTVLTGVAVVVVALLVLRARRGTALTELLPLAALAFVLALLVFQKVGSPQFMSMLAVPIVAGLAFGNRSFWPPAVIACVIAGMTQLIFPWYFPQLLALLPKLILVVTARNLLLVAMLAWVLIVLWRRGTRASVDA